MPEQLVLDLPFRAAMGATIFFVLRRQRRRLWRQSTAWRDWPGRKTACWFGGRAAPQTHLCPMFFAAQTGARHSCFRRDLPMPDRRRRPKPKALVVGGCRTRFAGDLPAEEALFHLHNAAAARGTGPAGHLRRRLRNRWRPRLPDCKAGCSRRARLTLAGPDGTRWVTAVRSSWPQTARCGTDAAYGAAGLIFLPRIDRSLAFVQAFSSRRFSMRRRLAAKHCGHPPLPGGAGPAT